MQFNFTYECNTKTDNIIREQWEGPLVRLNKMFVLLQPLTSVGESFVFCSTCWFSEQPQGRGRLKAPRGRRGRGRERVDGEEDKDSLHLLWPPLEHWEPGEHRKGISPTCTQIRWVWGQTLHYSTREEAEEKNKVFFMLLSPLSYSLGINLNLNAD